MANEYSEPNESSQGEETRGNWFALSVNVRHEKVVSELLRNKRFETFLPLYKRPLRYARRQREFELPLCPGYLFCHTTLVRWLAIMTTPGVIRIIGGGRTPIPMNQKEISSIKKALEAGVPMSPYHFCQSGEIGRIRSGSLAGVEGVVVKSKQAVRLILCVTLLRRAVMLEIDSNCVGLVPTGSAASVNRVWMSRGQRQELGARVFDSVFALPGLILFSPVFVAVALLISTCDGRPIFFCQTCIGMRGRPFRIIKFRTMRTKAEGAAIGRALG